MPWCLLASPVAQSMSIHIQAKHRPNSAFSLIEVVIALGVVAFALVAILGVFPTGLAANRTSINDTRAAQLLNAVTATIDAQCSAFSSVQLYGETLDLTTFTIGTAPKKLYVSYPSPDIPTISNDAALPNWIYTIEMQFDNDPSLNSSLTKLGPGKLSKIQLRLRGKSTAEGYVEVFYLARNRA